MNKQLIVLCGPTAVGKTAMAIQLAQNLHCEIISADSRQFFKELNIGVARPSISELSAVKHHFIASHSVHVGYNVGMYEKEALLFMEDYFKSHDKLIMVGGSGLYINAVCKGIDDLPQADEAIRSELKKIFDEAGVEVLQQILKEKDPEYYAQVDLKNHRRIMRAIEVIMISGSKYSALRAQNYKPRNFTCKTICLELPRPELYQRIDNRVENMIEEGLLAEVENLSAYKNLNALRTVGYTELFDFLEGKHDLQTATALIKQHTRNYAKRQITWFQQQENSQFVAAGNFNEVFRAVSP